MGREGLHQRRIGCGGGGADGAGAAAGAGGAIGAGAGAAIGAGGGTLVVRVCADAGAADGFAAAAGVGAAAAGAGVLPFLAVPEMALPAACRSLPMPSKVLQPATSVAAPNSAEMETSFFMNDLFRSV
jgi:hypothetical protein